MELYISDKFGKLLLYRNIRVEIAKILEFTNDKGKQNELKQ